MTTKFQVGIHSALAIGIIGTLLVIVLLPAMVYALPPRPTPEPTTEPTLPSAPSSKPTGGFIELCVQFPPTWPWTKVHWQDLWTTVQWQDNLGNWHTVEGWQGELDDVVVYSNEGVVGKKVWWSAETDQGKGPFRWLVTQGKDDALLVTSASFYLPARIGETVQVEVSLTP